MITKQGKSFFVLTRGFVFRCLFNLLHDVQHHFVVVAQANHLNPNWQANCRRLVHDLEMWKIWNETSVRASRMVQVPKNYSRHFTADTVGPQPHLVICPQNVCRQKTILFICIAISSIYCDLITQVQIRQIAESEFFVPA